MVKINNTNLKFNGSLTPINKSRITKIVQHHMAHKTWHLNDVHNYHKNGNGWAGIGYNYWIDFKGNIYQGRGFNVGAHAKGHNSTTLGIGYQGDFTTQTMPKAQLDAGIALNKWLMKQLSNKVDIVGHRDVGNTACPGKNFKLDELKRSVASTTTKPTTKPTSKPTAKPKGAYKGNSVVDYLNHNKMDSSFANRKNIASKYGIKGYKGTAQQNTTLLSKLRGDKPTSKPRPTKKYPLPTGVLRRGSKGNAVKQLQTALNKAYYKVGKVDGIYGAKTEDAVRRFQSVYLPHEIDGIAGKNTYRELDKIVNK